MPDTLILTQLFKSTSLVTLAGSAHKPRVTLDEPQAPDSSATISGLPADVFVIKVDDFRSPDEIFNGTKGECKRADYVIISERKRCILYIELKRTKAGWNHIVKQLLGAKCFVNYCQGIGKEFWNDPNFLTGYKHRFISIAHTSISKRPTRFKKNGPVHDSPQKAMKIDWPKNLQFNQLTGV